MRGNPPPKGHAFFRILTIFILTIALTFTGYDATPAYASFASVGEASSAALDAFENFLTVVGMREKRKEVQEEHGVRIQPYFSTAFDFTDNVFNRPGHLETNDEIFTFTPGIRVSHQGDYGSAGINYEAAFRYMMRHPTQNEQNQNFRAWLTLTPSENTTIRVTESLAQRGSIAGGEDFEPTNTTDNTVDVTGNHVVGPWEFEAGYRNFNRHFAADASDRLNYNEDVYSYRTYHELPGPLENLDIYSGAQVGNVEYSRDNSRDTLWFEIPLGVRGKLPLNGNIDANVGLHRRNLESERRNDLTLVTANVQISHVFNNNRTQTSAGFVRRPVESSYSNTAFYDEKLWTTSMKHVVNKRVRVRGNAYWGNRDWEERTFFGSRVAVGGVVFVSPPGRKKRTDDIWGMGVGIDVKVSESVTWHTDYKHNRRDSNISSLDNTENRLTTRISVVA